MGTAMPTQFRPPIRKYGNLVRKKTGKNDFRNTLFSPLKEVSDAFDRQMNTALEKNIATISEEFKRENTGANAHAAQCPKNDAHWV